MPTARLLAGRGRTRGAGWAAGTWLVVSPDHCIHAGGDFDNCPKCRYGRARRDHGDIWCYRDHAACDRHTRCDRNHGGNGNYDHDSGDKPGDDC